MSRTRGEQSVRGKCCVSRRTAPRLARLDRTAGIPTIRRDVCLGTLGRTAASGAPSASVRRSVSRQETTLWNTGRHAQEPKTQDGAALCAPRSVGAFTAMKRFVNTVSVALHAGVAKDCRHGIASRAQRHCLRAHPPDWVAGAGCISRLCTAAGTSARLLAKLRSAGGTRRNVPLLGHHRQPGPASVLDLERQPLRVGSLSLY